MSKTKGTEISSEQTLRAVPLPKQEESGRGYTVISHGDIIDTIEKELNKNGFEITETEYTHSYNGEVAKGKIYIKCDRDPDMGMLFVWQNSYNKKVKFGCAIGGYIYDNKAPMVGTEGLAWIRKHNGTADQEAVNVIEQLIEHAEEHFQSAIKEKERMKALSLDVETYGCIMGALYFEHELITPTQATVVKNERKKPSFEYQDKDTLWGLYKILMYGIDGMDITKWQTSQQKLHHMIMAEYAIAVEELVDKPNADFTISHNSLVGMGDLDDLPVDDSPQIDGIPNGDTMSDTDDDDLSALADGGDDEEVLTSTEIDSEITAIEEGLNHKGEVDERLLWAEEELSKEPTGEDVGPPEMYLGDQTEQSIDDELDDIFARTSTSEEKEEEKEEEFPSPEEAKANAKENTRNYFINAKKQDPAIVDYWMENHYKDEMTFKECEDAFAKYINKDDSKEEPKAEAELTSLLNNASNLSPGENKEALEVLEQIEEPVDILSPEESKEKTTEEFVFPTDLDDPEKLNAEESKQEETAQDFLDIQEHEGLTVPGDVIEQAAVIEQRMTLLYGGIRPYQIEEIEGFINVTIEDTKESFYVEV